MALLSREYLETFFMFLDNATEVELRERKAGLEALLDETKDREFRRDIRWLIGKINEELLTRLTP